MLSARERRAVIWDAVLIVAGGILVIVLLAWLGKALPPPIQHPPVVTGEAV